MSSSEWNERERVRERANLRVTGGSKTCFRFPFGNKELKFRVLAVVTLLTKKPQKTPLAFPLVGMWKEEASKKKEGVVMARVGLGLGDCGALTCGGSEH